MEYVIDATEYNIPDHIVDQLKENPEIIKGFGVNAKLSKGCYVNPKMKAKIIVKYKNGTFEGKLRSVMDCALSYEILVIYNKFIAEENKQFLPLSVQCFNIID